VYAKEILSNYFSHFNPIWLFITGDIARHHAPEMGLLYLWDLPFLLIGIYGLCFHSFPGKTKALVFSWFLIAPIPSAIASGAPHAVRALNFLPVFQIFIAVGILAAVSFVKNINLLKGRIWMKTAVYTAVLLLFLFNFIYYLDQYFRQTNYFTAGDWLYGYEQMISDVRPTQSAYNKIIVSDTGYFSQSYIYFLFYLKYDPALYLRQGGTLPPGGSLQRFSNFVFEQVKYASRRNSHVLYIGGPSDFPGKVKPVFRVSFPNGQTAMEAVRG
jgi:hypothetical protein